MEVFNDREHLLRGEWETCCVKKRPTGDEKAGAFGYSAFGVLTTTRSSPVVVYLRDEDPKNDLLEKKEYADIDAMLADGWVVD